MQGKSTFKPITTNNEKTFKPITTNNEKTTLVAKLKAFVAKIDEDNKNNQKGGFKNNFKQVHEKPQYKFKGKDMKGTPRVNFKNNFKSVQGKPQNKDMK